MPRCICILCNPTRSLCVAESCLMASFKVNLVNSDGKEVENKERKLHYSIAIADFAARSAISLLTVL